MSYEQEEHKSNDPQNYSKRQRSIVNCGGNEARENKRQRLPEETDGNDCARTEAEDKSSNSRCNADDSDILPSESTNSSSSSTNRGVVSTSVSSSRINDSDAKPTSFNDASPCVESRLEEDDDIKCLHVDRVFPSVPAIHVLSSSKAEGQEGDIIHTPLDTTETATATDSGQGETPMIVDSWQAFMDKQDNKGQDSNEHQNMSAPQGEPLGLVPPSSTYRVSWQESNKNKAYSHHHHHHQPFEQHGNKRSTSLYYNADAAPHFRHDTSTHTTPHLSYGSVKQQEIAPSVVTRSDDISSSNYQRTTSGSGESTSPSRNNTSSYSPQLQYGQSDGTARSNSYPDNPHATGTYFSHHPAKVVHSYLYHPVPPINEAAHSLNDSGELRYDSYYPPNAITGGEDNHIVNTKTQGDRMGTMARGQQRNQHSTNQNIENQKHDGEISSAYAAHHQNDHPQYDGRSQHAAQKARNTSASSSSSFNNSLHLSTGSEALQPYYNRPVLSLSTNDDGIWLSEFLCFVRSQCVEVFAASQDDVAERMNSKKVLLGQVGFRCRFCAHLPHRERTGRSSSFPSSIKRIYQSLTMMLRDHFTKCNAMPPQMNARYLCLKANANKGARRIDSRKYWTESARTLGLVDTKHDGLRFQHPRGHDNSGAAGGGTSWSAAPTI